MLQLDDARGRLAAAVAQLPPRRVGLRDALGRRLAETVFSDTDLPPFDASAMDGYAVCAADLSTENPLPVVFEVQAGSLPPALPPGTAARIFTGAPLPTGADTVVPQEQAEPAGPRAIRLTELPRGSHVRHAGEVVECGDPVGEPNDLVNPQRLAVLAAAGCATVAVVPRPTVAILVTGAELLRVDDPPAPGRIRNSNGPMLEGLAGQAGLQIVASETANDEIDTLQIVLARLSKSADLVLTSGGVSVGEYDLVPAAVGALGGEILLHKVAMQPGKPVLVARLARSWLIGLPGNPLSVLVGWRMFARPLAEALAGDGLAFGESPLAAVLTGAVRNNGRRTQLRPATLQTVSDRVEATVLRWRGSHDVVAAARATALVRLEPGAELAAGAQVAAYSLSWSPASSRF